MIPSYRCVALDEPAPAGGQDDAVRVLHFFRHGEALHQVRNAEAEMRGVGCRCFAPIFGDNCSTYVCPYWSEDLIDAPLTDLGRRETVGRGAHLPINTVFASPLLRTVESAVLAFPQAARIVVLPELRARIGRHMHSKRSSRTELARQFPQVDITRISCEDDDAWSIETEPRGNLEARALQFLEYAFTQPEREIAVVTHFTLFLALLLAADETFTLGPSQRPSGAPAFLDTSASASPLALREPPRVGECRSLVIVRG